jgi:hypothetical protein
MLSWLRSRKKGAQQEEQIPAKNNPNLKSSLKIHFDDGTFKHEINFRLNMKRLFFLIFSAVVLITISSCSKTTDYNEGPGQLVVKVTDAPFPINFIESATVTITKIEIRKAGDTISDGNPYIVVSDDTLTFNLLELRNGITETLPAVEIPQGKYDLVRLYVDKASLKIKDGDTFNVKVPSGQQTGIKIFIKPAIIVEGGLTSELLLDFDLSGSFVMRGSLDNPHGINGFIFKPVIRAVNNTTAGRIAGIVTDTSKVKLANAEVWVKQDSILSRAFTDSLGHYAFLGVPAGTYSLFATKQNYDTVSFTGVKVVESNMTIKDFVLTHQ